MMNGEEAIKIIEQLLIGHRQTHVNWLEFLTRNPHREMEYRNSVGDAKHQRECIANYDKASKALDVLKEKNNG